MAQNPPYILTVKEFHEEKIKEKGSVFIGQVYPVKSEENFDQILAKVKKKFYDASHHCYAFKLSSEVFRYSDAGEPTGTAGIRILNAIEHFELTETAVIIIRYFGGTKLGAGPLGKAYYAAAQKALENVKRIKLNPFYRIIFEVGFDEISHPHRILSSYGAEISDITYGEAVRFVCLIRPESYNDLLLQLTDSLKREIHITKEENIIYKSGEP